MERGGQIRAKKISNLSAKMVRGRIADSVAEGTPLMTDEHPSYKGLDFSPRQHPILSVNHNKGEYARYAVHINPIEGAWSLFKRQVYGIHHWISVKHLDAYLGEMCYRYSNRDMEDGARLG